MIDTEKLKDKITERRINEVLHALAICRDHLLLLQALEMDDPSFYFLDENTTVKLSQASDKVKEVIELVEHRICHE